MITIRTNFYWKIKISANKQEEELSKSGKKELTFTSTINIWTHISSPPRLTFIDSQNRRSLASTTEEQLPDLRSEKKNP